MKTAIVFGTRPEIIKLGPIINKLTKKNSILIFTGQHYDFEMSRQFLGELGIRKPDFWLKISRSNPTVQIGEIIMKLSKILRSFKPDTTIVEGDTNTVLAAAISSIKSEIPVSHVEAGVRSYDWRMPEEHNRIQVDHISELLFAPTSLTKKNLTKENVHGKLFVTGNTVIDSVNKYTEISSKKSKLTYDGDSQDFILLTMHRAENVDNKKIIFPILKGILDSNEKFVFPVHPRTLKRLHQFGLYNKLKKSNVLMLKSVGYFDMLELMKKCSFIVTDSGGIQEEATSPKIRKKVLVVRKTTDRPEAVSAGFSELIGLTHSQIRTAIKRTTKNPRISAKTNPYGNGHASEKIIRILKNTKF